MYAHQRESDEEIDEDDMTIGELQRIKEMTSSGSDLDSDADVTYEERRPDSQVDFSDKNSVRFCCVLQLLLLSLVA